MNVHSKPAPKAADLVRFQQAVDDYPAFGERYLRRLIAERRIRYCKIGRLIFLSRSDLDQLVADSIREALP